MKKIKPDGSKTLYVGGIYEVDKASGGAVTRTVTYYPVGGAMRVDGTLYYMLKDHLGSASVLTNASGNVVSGADVRYYPFGEARSSTGSMLTDKLFTGQREMAGLGIYHYQARFYSPKLGRFLSADTITPDPANPQYLNRYSYVLGNPLRYIDPTGHGVDCGIGNMEDCVTQPSNPSGSSGGRGDEGNTDTNGNGIPDVPDPNWVIPEQIGVCQYSNLVECLYSGGYWPSGDYTFSDEEWAMFERALALDIARRRFTGDGFWTLEFDPTGRFPNIIRNPRFLPFHTAGYYEREGYDTIFWNGSETGDPPYKGNVCFESGSCYDRTEVNYIAQGMWSTAASEGYHGAVAAAVLWNFSKYGHSANANEIYWSIRGATAFVTNGPYEVVGK